MCVKKVFDIAKVTVCFVVFLYANFPLSYDPSLPLSPTFCIAQCCNSSNYLSLSLSPPLSLSLCSESNSTIS